jgi:dihydroorotase
MPNLKPPVTTVDQAAAYRDRILSALPAGACFRAADDALPDRQHAAGEVAKAAASGFVKAVKLYPAGATTNSDAGLTDIAKAVRYAGRNGAPRPAAAGAWRGDRSGHRPLRPRKGFHRHRAGAADAALSRGSRWSWSTSRPGTRPNSCVDSPSTVAATITAHHLLYNRNAIFQGGVRPHWYCLPVLKRETHREALVAAAISGNPKFFLGTDSAPHARMTKEAACGCAGCYTAYAALELYAEVFEQAGALDRLEAFASFHGPDWYGLPRNTGTVTLVKEALDGAGRLPVYQRRHHRAAARRRNACPGKCADSRAAARVSNPSPAFASSLYDPLRRWLGHFCRRGRIRRLSPRWPNASRSLRRMAGASVSCRRRRTVSPTNAGSGRAAKSRRDPATGTISSMRWSG